MFLQKNKKPRFISSVFVLGASFLFALSFLVVKENVLAAPHDESVYQKGEFGTLTHEDWNNLLSDFVNTWLPTSMTGPLGIGTGTPSVFTSLDVGGKFIFSTGGILYNEDQINPRFLSFSANVGSDALKVAGDLNTTQGVLKAGGIGNSYIMGNLSLGTTTVSDRLTISGNINLPNYNAWGYIKNSAQYGGLRLGTGNSSGTYVDGIEISSAGGYVKLNHNTVITGNASVSNSATISNNLFVTSGNVGIGTTTVPAPLTIQQKDNANGFALYGNYDPTSYFKFFIGAEGANNPRFNTNRSLVFEASQNIYLRSTGSMLLNDSNTNNVYLVSGGGKVAIGTTTASSSARMRIIPSGSYSIDAGGGNIGGVGAPLAGSDVVNMDYLISSLASSTADIITQVATSSFWQGQLNGNIWSNNTGNVGIGTSSPATKLDIASGILSIGAANTSNGKQSSLRIYSYDNAAQQMGTLAANYEDLKRTIHLSGSANTNQIKIDASANLNGNIILMPGSSGNVGIGTTNPQKRLDLGGGTSGRIYGIDTSTSAIFTDSEVVPKKWIVDNFAPAVGGASLWATSTAGIYNVGLGNVGIGTTTPADKLQVYGNAFLGKISGYPFKSLWSWDSDNTGYYSGIGYQKSDGTNQKLFAWWKDNVLETNINSVLNVATITNTFNGAAPNTGRTIGASISASGISYFNGGSVGIGTIAPISSVNGLDISSGGLGLIVGAENATNARTNNTIKYGRIASPHYINAEEPMIGMVMSSQSTSNILNLGGGTSMGNAATGILFYTAANNTTVTGLERMRITNAGNVAIGTTTATSTLVVSNLTTKVIDVQGGHIGGLNSTPLADDYAVPLGYLKNNYNASSTNFWGGSLGGNIWSNNAGSIGIGTTTPAVKLHVVGRPAIRWGYASSYATWYGQVGNYGYSEGQDSLGGVQFLSQRDSGSSSSAFYSFNTQIGANSSIARLVINYDGNVGIGTSSPATKLEVNSGASQVAAKFVSSGAGVFNDFQSAIGSGRIGFFSQNVLGFAYGVGTTPHLSINSSGNVIIGTTSPAAKLHVDGTGYFSNTVTVGTPTAPGHAATKSYVDGIVATSSDTAIGFWTKLSGKLYPTDTSLNVGIGTTDPSEKLESRGGNSNSLIYGALLSNADNTNTGGSMIGLGFAVNNITVPKAGVLFERTASYGLGNLYFSLNNVADNTTKASKADAKMTILNNGNVGIGTSNPVSRLDVAGYISSSNNLGSPTSGNSLNIAMSGGIGYLTSYNYTGSSYLPLHLRGSVTVLGMQGNVGIGAINEAVKLNISGGNVFINDAAITAGTPNAAITKSYLDSSLGAYLPGSSRSYNSVVGDTGADDWYSVAQISDSTNSPATFSIKGYAHSSVLFSVVKGYQSVGAINILNYESGCNSGYKCIKGVRLTSDGTVQVKLGGGSITKISVTAFGAAAPVLYSTLNRETGSPALIDNVETLISGMVRTSGPIHVNSGNSIFNGNVGVGTSSPRSILNLYINNTSTSGLTNGLTVEQAGTGDSTISFLITGVRGWMAGVDNSDSDKFKIGASSSGFDADTKLTITTDGNVGIGTTNPQKRLDLGGGTSGRIYGIDTSTSAIFTDSEVVPKKWIVDNFAPAVGGASLWATSSAGIYNVGLGNVGIGTTNPTSKLDVSGNLNATSFSGNGSKLTYVNRSILNIFESSTSAGQWVKVGSIDFSTMAYRELEATYKVVAKFGVAEYSVRMASGLSGQFYSPYIYKISSAGVNVPELELYQVDSGTNVQYELYLKWDSNYIQTALVEVGFAEKKTGDYALMTYATTSPFVSSIPSGRTKVSTVNFFALSNVGNVGIGTTAPNKKMEIVGGLESFETVLLQIRSNSSTNNTASVLKFLNSTDSSSNNGSGEISVVRTNVVYGGDSDMLFRTAQGAALSEIMRLKSNGNVGIGTTTPAAGLEVLTGSNYSILAGNKRIGNVASPVASTDAVNRSYVDTNFAPIGGGASLWATSTAGTYNVGLGNVGIGTTNPQSDLHIGAGGLGYIDKTRLTLEPPQHTGGPWKFDVRDVSSGPSNLDITYGSSKKLTINSSGNVGIGTTNPSGLLSLAKFLSLNDNQEMFSVSHDAAYNLKLYQNFSASGVMQYNWVQKVAGVDNNVLTFKQGNVGIGTTSPATKLHVYNGSFQISDGSSPSTGLYINPSGVSSGVTAVDFLNVGNSRPFNFRVGGTNTLFVSPNKVSIGTTTATTTLFVDGAGYFTNVVTVGTPTAPGHAATKNYVDSIAAPSSDPGTQSGFWTSGSNNSIYNNNSGNVGIGTNNPLAKLHVNGGVILKTTFVNNTNYTAQADDYIIAYESIDGDRTVTLPDSLCTPGRFFVVMDQSGSASPSKRIIIDPGGPSVNTPIVGQLTFTLSSPRNAVYVFCGNNAWFLL